MQSCLLILTLNKVTMSYFFQWLAFYKPCFSTAPYLLLQLYVRNLSLSSFCYLDILPCALTIKRVCFVSLQFPFWTFPKAFFNNGTHLFQCGELNKNEKQNTSNPSPLRDYYPFRSTSLPLLFPCLSRV